MRFDRGAHRAERFHPEVRVDADGAEEPAGVAFEDLVRLVGSARVDVDLRGRDPVVIHQHDEVVDRQCRTHLFAGVAEQVLGGMMLELAAASVLEEAPGLVHAHACAAAREFDHQVDDGQAGRTWHGSMVAVRVDRRRSGWR